MPYCIEQVEFAAFPSESAVTEALSKAGLPQEVVIAAVRSFICQAPRVDGFGYQQSIADHLEVHLRSVLAVGPVRSVGTRVSPALNEKADLAFARDGADMAIYFEIEFRPNVEKDLIKFQIAHNRHQLSAAVLIVARDRARVNASYATMPEFAKVSRVIAELRPTYPLLLVGIDGSHRA